MLGNRGNVAVLMERSSRSERSGISTALRERVWGQAATRTVRAVTVVVFSPHRTMGSCMAHAVELIQCKQFVSRKASRSLNVRLPNANEPSFRQLRREIDGKFIRRGEGMDSVHHGRSSKPIVSYVILYRHPNCNTGRDSHLHYRRKFDSSFGPRERTGQCLDSIGLSE